MSKKKNSSEFFKTKILEEISLKVYEFFIDWESFQEFWAQIQVLYLLKCRNPIFVMSWFYF